MLFGLGCSEKSKIFSEGSYSGCLSYARLFKLYASMCPGANIIIDPNIRCVGNCQEPSEKRKFQNIPVRNKPLEQTMNT